MAEAGPRRGLGRGLDALLGGPTDAVGATAPELPIDAIRANPGQPRRHIDPDALEALAASIRHTGLVQPVVVRPPDDDGMHELIAGERRWRAARSVGLTAIPAVLREADEGGRLELALVENIVREDLNALEVARACAALVEDFGRTQGEIAERLGRSRPAVSNLMRLLELPDDVQDLVVTGRLTEGHARAVLMADGARGRRRLAETIVEQDLSVREAERLARAGGPTPARPRARRPALADDALEAFGSAFGAPVRVRGRSGGEVVVELRFADEGALAEALRSLPRP